MGRMFRVILFFDQKKKVYLYMYLRKIYRKYEIWQTNGNLRRRHFLLNCWPVICSIISSIQQYMWLYMKPWGWPEEIKHCSVARQRPLLLLWNLLTSSKHPCNSLSGCFCILLVHIDGLELLDASFSESKPLSTEINVLLSLASAPGP